MLIAVQVEYLCAIDSTFRLIAFLMTVIINRVQFHPSEVSVRMKPSSSIQSNYMLMETASRYQLEYIYDLKMA